jgi:hypothetical protein
MQTKPVMVYLDTATYNRLTEMTKKGYSRSKLVRIWITEALDRAEQT